MRRCLQKLRTFCLAAQAGNFSKAAERLALSQLSVSLQVQTLQRELGTTLFQRRGSKIGLRRIGRRCTTWPAHAGIDGSNPLLEVCGTGAAGRLS